MNKETYETIMLLVVDGLNSANSDTLELAADVLKSAIRYTKWISQLTIIPGKWKMTDIGLRPTIILWIVSISIYGI